MDYPREFESTGILNIERLEVPEGWLIKSGSKTFFMRDRTHRWNIESMDDYLKRTKKGKYADT